MKKFSIFDVYGTVHDKHVETPKVKVQAYSPISLGRKTPKVVDGKFSLMESLRPDESYGNPPREDEDRPLATDVKRHFLEIISTYTSFQEQMKRPSDIVEVAETLGGVVEAAKTLTLNETGDWFDKVTVKRNMSELDKLDKSFDKVAQEARALDQRLSALYEDMGSILGRYYEISDLDPAVMRERLGLKDKVHESYTVKVSRGSKNIGKKTVLGSHLKETVSKLKSKYKDSTILVLNEGGKVVGTIYPPIILHRNVVITEQMLRERFNLPEKIIMGLFILGMAGGISLGTHVHNFRSKINSDLQAGKEVYIPPRSMEKAFGDTFGGYKFTEPYGIRVDKNLSSPISIDTAINMITLKTPKLDNKAIVNQLKKDIGIKSGPDGDFFGDVVQYKMFQNHMSGKPLGQM